jgi:Ca2+-binding EF-hand superfamily protein
MKKLLKPLIASALVLAVSGVHAENFTGAKVKKFVRIMDDNGDRKVNFQEFYEETVSDNRDSLDTNYDGYITAGEVVIEIKEDLIETIAEMRKLGVSEENINKTIANELEMAEKEAEAIIKKMDTDGDNLVEPEEFLAYKKRQFRAMDRNRDGVISNTDIKKEKVKRKKGFPIQWGG